MNQALESEFHDEMISLYRKIGYATGYWANRFLQKVRKEHGLSAARQLLKPEKGLSPGLRRLAKENRIDLSMEALVVKEPWSEMFTAQEINEANKRIEIAKTL